MTIQPAAASHRRRDGYPMPWRPMVTITWLQHRVPLITGSVLFAGTALAITGNALGPRTTQTNTLDLVTIVLLSIPVLVGMFDEVNEGTAIYKVADQIPVGKYFVTYEGLPSDYYLKLTGAATQMIRGETPLSETIPEKLPGHREQ